MNLRKLGVLQMVYRKFQCGDGRFSTDEILSRVLDEIANELGQGVDVKWTKEADVITDRMLAWDSCPQSSDYHEDYDDNVSRQ